MQKLELTWIGKGQEPVIEPRILLGDAERGYGAANAHNMLIHGDNLLALKALEQCFAGRVKCIYIDPPFNTRQAFEHYEDGLEHSIWLNLMYARLKLLWSLLSKDGTLYVHIDDNEFCYLIALIDEVFGRQNRVSIVTFKQASATGHKAINPGVVNITNFILIYAKNKGSWLPNRIYTAYGERDKRYGQFIENFNDPFEKWKFITLSKAFAATLGLAEREVKKQLGDEYEEKISDFVQKNANQVIQLAKPDYAAVSNAARVTIDASLANVNNVFKLTRQNYSDMYFIRGKRILFYSDKLKLIDGESVAGEPLTSLWDDILSNNIHNEGDVEFPKGKKPEALIKRIIELATNPGDLVLDSFLGSGTTAAVAHKMGRHWIGVEFGDHCYTHCLPRLQKVVDGEQGGISKAVAWKGGGGFRFYELAPTLIVKDENGLEIISDKYCPTMLAAAVAKLCGYQFAPRKDNPYIHGVNGTGGYIFVTTEFVTPLFLDDIAKKFHDGQKLTICASAFQPGIGAGRNDISLRKIPQSVLAKCEYGAKHYNLNVVDMPEFTETEEDFEDAE